tara:strand:- start:2870 stop:3574 length:705 start_codon:yes stop_codon:yes gene_type:complete
MTKNIKWAKVDSVTGISEIIATATNGAIHPTLSGLESTFDWGQFYYGTADDSVTVDASNFIFEISDAEWISDITGKIQEFVRDWDGEAYKEERDLRESELGNYADSVYASASGYKYDAAVAFISSATPNAGLTTEAFYRDCTVGTLAAKIKTNHEAYIEKEAKIAGLRGLITDRINGIMAGIDTSTVTKALESYVGIHSEEKIGITTVGISTEYSDINVGYYKPGSIRTRYQYL